MKSVKWRATIISVIAILAAYAVSPTLIYFSQPADIRNDAEAFEASLPSALPKSHVKLGLDLQGGVQLVLGVHTEHAISAKLGRVAAEMEKWADSDDIAVVKAFVGQDSQELAVELKAETELEKFREKLRDVYPFLEQFERDGSKLRYVYKVEEKDRIRQSALEQAERVIRNRVDQWGVAEPVINRRSDGSILVQLPGFKDPEKAKSLLGRTAELKFKIVDDAFTGFAALQSNVPEGVSYQGGVFVGEDREQLIEYLKASVPEDRELLFSREQIGSGDSTRYQWTSYVVFARTELGGDDVQDALVGQGAGLDRQPEVSLRLTGPGGRRFAEVTGNNVNKRMAIVLDDVVESAPVIRSKISGGTASIQLGSGQGFQEKIEEATQLALILKSGAIPASIDIEEERQVGASLGPELADDGIRGILFGLGFVLVFMLVYYRRPGLIACVTLVLNALLLLAVMAGFGFALTLPGIAGFILTLGMAVDANVLINERIRQEVREGKNPRRAIEVGFNKVFWTIIDANVTTLIAAIVLLETNASGPIRGFAVTLIIGLLVSLFTSLYCSRVFFQLASSGSNDAALKKWLGAGEGRKIYFDFLKFGKPFTFIFASLALVVGVGTAVRGLNYGVDFAGGTEVIIGFEKDVDSAQIRSIADQNALEGFSVQALDGGQRQYLLRFDQKAEGDDPVDGQAATTQSFVALKEAVQTQLADSQPEFKQVDFVGPQVGRALRNQGALSVIYAIFGVLLYIAFRFDSRFAPGAVVKMVLDVCVMLGFYTFFWRSFDLVSVAAFLTVVGYSVNDTIVIYDRIREAMQQRGAGDMVKLVNQSLSETLSRTLNTSITTVASLGGILIFGSGQIWDFAMATTIGVVTATLSSTFVASSFVIWLDQREKDETAKVKGSASPVAAKA
ncbi:MAG: protein translocase subunit SecD [Oligoflexales bacterium]